MGDALTAAILTAGLDRDEDGNLTPEAEENIAALKEIANDPELLAELEGEINGNANTKDE